MTQAVKLNQFVAALLSAVQTLEDAALETLLGRFLDNAVGAQLDGLGDLVGEDRLGRGDDDYRNAIRVRIFQNAASGTPEEMLTLIRYLVPDAPVYAYHEIHPAKVAFAADFGTKPANLQELMQAAAPAGVGVTVLGDDDLVFRAGRNRAGDLLKG